MNYLYVLLLATIVWLTGCQSKNNETTIPDASSVENLTEASLNILNESIEDDPSNDFLYYKRALFYFHHHNYTKALLDANKAIELEEDKGEYYLLLGQVSYADGNVKIAKEAALKAESLLDDVPALMVLQSNIYLDLKDTVKYNNYIAKTVSLIPFKADADFVQARKSLIDRDSVHALNYFQSAVKKDPDYLPAYKEIIKIYMHKAMYDSSMSYVLNGIRISHQAPLFYEAEGRFFEKVKLYGAAESAYLIALKYSNNKAEYLELLGDLKNKQYDYKTALSWYVQLFKQRPGDVKLLHTCAVTAYNARDWSKASFYYGKLIATDSSNISNKQHYQYAVKQAYDTDSIETLSKTNVMTLEDKITTMNVSDATNKSKTVVSNNSVNLDPQAKTNTAPKEEVVKRKPKVKIKDSVTISGSKVVVKQDTSSTE